MDEVFRYVTPITYGLLVTVWLYVFIFYLKKIKIHYKKDNLLGLLLIILIIDAFRTIFEGVYFGLRHASSEGFISSNIFETLTKPQYVFLPKFITLITGVLILVLVLYKWLPAEVKRKLAIKDLINKKNAELLKKNLELIKAKERAEQSDRLKTEFLNNMSHEIRTPMNGIIGFSTMLDKPDISDEKRNSYAKIVKSSSRQLLRIIDDILEISNLETKQEKLNNTQFCLNNFLMELFSIFNLKFRETGVKFNINKALSDKDSFIITDRVKLNKILSNLLENAYRYTNKGSVEIGYNISDNSIVFYVKDTGIGISPENHSIIFDRFSQEDHDISLEYGGLGLGLSISKENVKLMGGTISLDSEKSKGSTFYVTIPYVPSSELVEEIIKTEVGYVVPENNSKCTILVAEDEDMNYLYVETLLEDYKGINFNIIHAKNGREAVDICKANKDIDIVLMDIKMPVMNGYIATKEIKLLVPDLPIIAHTAYSNEREKQQALDNGCNDFISKPIDIDDFFVLIKKYVNKA